MKTIQVRGKNKILLAQVDDEDFESCAMYNWIAKVNKKNIYAISFDPFIKTTTSLSMHRIILDVKDPRVLVHHIDGNGLNNQKSNLRLCTPSQNCHNSKLRHDSSTGFKGVCFQKTSKKFISHIKINHKKIHIGLFNTAIEAARARDLKAKELHGEFARLNQA